MKFKFEVEHTEVYKTTIEVDADTLEEAETKAYQSSEVEDIALNKNTYDSSNTDLYQLCSTCDKRKEDNEFCSNSFHFVP